MALPPYQTLGSSKRLKKVKSKSSNPGKVENTNITTNILIYAVHKIKKKVQINFNIKIFHIDTEDFTGSSSESICSLPND